MMCQWKYSNYGFTDYTGTENIHQVLYEAAAIDGANQVQTFVKITLPLMKPVIQVNVTMAVISALKQMETVYLLTTVFLNKIFEERDVKPKKVRRAA